MTTMCGYTPRIRSRNTSSNPPVTDITAVSVATPTAIPAIDTTVAADTLDFLRPENSDSPSAHENGSL